MLKNKKIFVVLLVAVLFLFIFLNNKSSAFSFSYNETNINLADLPFDYKNENAHFVIAYSNKGGYYFLIYYIGADFQKFYCVPNDYITTYNTNGNEIKDGSVKLCDYDMSSESWGSVKNWGATSIYNSYIVFSSDDVYTSDGKIFFQKPELEKMILAPVLEIVEMDKVLVQIIQILPMILVVVVSLVGLRKGWQVLSKLLHQA